MTRTYSFGQWVKRQRKALDLTQAALARQVGCAAITIRKIEADERRPSRQMAIRLAECLEIAPEEQTHFIEIALGERPVDTMALPRAPVATERGERPAWLEKIEERSPEDEPFVGRGRELVFLKKQLKEALEGQGRVAFVSGEAGRGKTALLAALVREAQGEHPALIAAQGYCTAAAGLGDPYLPFRDMLVSLLGDLDMRWQSGTLSAEQARRLWAFAPRVAQTLLSSGPQLAGALLPADSLSRWSESTAESAAGEAEAWAGSQQSRLAEQFTAVLQGLASERPLLLLIDDLQWADTASVSLLFHLARRIRSSPILIVGAYRRSEVAAGAKQQPGTPLQQTILEIQRLFGETDLDLEQFDPEEARRLSDAILDREPNRLGESFRVKLFWHTRGHPLFLLELLEELKARGDLVLDEDGLWIEGRAIDWEGLPSRVAAVIEQRLARLAEDERELLEIAAVEGERFTAEAVAAVAGLEEGRALRLLARELARRHGLIQERGDLQADGQRLARFQFRHVLFQHYLYDRLGESERRHLHGRVAIELQRLHQGNVEPMLAQLAHHFAEAGSQEQAVKYLLEAGDRARTLYAHQEAAGHYERALAILREQGELERTARTLMKLGLTYQIGFDYQNAQRAFDEAFALWPRTSGPVPGVEPGQERMASSARLSPAPHPLRLLWLDPESLDPTMGGYNRTAPLATQLFSGLVTYGPGSDLWPDVARGWEIQDEGRTYLFHLRDDVFWSDGHPATAHDFEFTYKRALDPATGAPVAGQLLSALVGARELLEGQAVDPEQVGVRALDDHTLLLELAEPTSYFIHNLAYYVLLPVPRHVVERIGQEWATPERIVTNGPFRLRNWEPGQFMLLERNPRYHGSFSGNLEQVSLILGRHPSDQVALYEADQLDVVSNWYATTAEIDRLRNRFPADYVRRPYFVTLYFFMNVAIPPLEDRRVRQALGMSIDRRVLAQGPWKGYVEPAGGGMVPPGMPGHVPDCGLTFDRQRARQLLAEAGFPGGRDFPKVQLFAHERLRPVVSFLQSSWKEALNIDVELEELYTPLTTPPQEYLDRFALLMGSWIADYPDPDTFLRVDVELSVPQWRHPAYWRLLEEASRMTDQAERLQRYRQAELILAEEAPLVPLCYESFHLMLKPWVKQYPTAAVKYPGFWKDVIIDPHEA